MTAIINNSERTIRIASIDRIIMPGGATPVEDYETQNEDILDLARRKIIKLRRM